MSNKKVALMTGVTGQDGAYLAKFLLEKGYIVHGLKRRASSFNTERLDQMFRNYDYSDRFFTHYSDLTDSTNILRLLKKIAPDELYNLGAQSHVQVSFEAPEYTANADAIGTLRLLEAIRILGLENKTKFYQASTSELYGKVREIPQSEITPFYPRSPYGAAKLYAYSITVNYRDAYHIFASNGILFNHESPFRGPTFVTRKITRAVSRIALGIDEILKLGNLDSKRDWGHAKDYVRGMWMILNHTEPDDFVLATGKITSVREFVLKAFKVVGIDLEFENFGLEEIGRDKKTGKILVTVDPKYFRAAEVDHLQGNALKAKQILNWEPTISVDQLCEEMVLSDLANTSIELNSKKLFKVFDEKINLNSNISFEKYIENLNMYSDINMIAN